MIRLSRQEIREIIASTEVHPDPHDTDEMALPTWLHWNPLIRWLFRRRLETMLDLAALKGHEQVLDFGCGIGVLLPSLACQAGKVYATDLFPQYAQRLAKRRDLEVTFVSDIDEIPAGSLDVIFAADVMEHLDAPDAWAQRFAGLLKPGGRLIVSGPTENIAYRIGRWLAGFGDKGDYHHTNVHDLEAIVAQNGYTPRGQRFLPWGLMPRLFSISEFEVAAVPRDPAS